MKLEILIPQSWYTICYIKSFQLYFYRLRLIDHGTPKRQLKAYGEFYRQKGPKVETTFTFCYISVSREIVLESSMGCLKYFQLQAFFSLIVTSVDCFTSKVTRDPNLFLSSRPWHFSYLYIMLYLQRGINNTKNRVSCLPLNL